MVGDLPFKHIIAIDFEFEFGGHARWKRRAGPAKGRGRSAWWRRNCAAARHGDCGATEFESQPPFPIGADTVLVAYYASAELGCFRALGWPPPIYVLDLFTEFRARTNGLSLPNGAGLLGALTFFGIDGISITEKPEMRALILSGGPWSADDRAAILEYCESDVLALERLLPAMLPRIDLPRALLRGRFMKAAAAIEWNGTPIDSSNPWLAAASLDRNSRRLDRRYRSRLRRVRRPQLPRGAVAAVAGKIRHSLAYARYRSPGFV